MKNQGVCSSAIEKEGTYSAFKFDEKKESKVEKVGRDQGVCVGGG